ncbi:MAG: AAA-like domain-containing protein [Lachnospiraceae bacterium]
MGRRFNVTGTCIPEKHYMADTKEKLDKIVRLIEQDSYFTINRARQYGKTTTLMLLWKRLKERYIVISTSFEGMGNEAFRTEDMFVRRFCMRVAGALKLSDYKDEPKSLWTAFSEDENMDTLKERIVTFCSQADREVLLFIDEVDKSSDNQMFLNFLGVLRELYLERAMGTVTFKSVILASVHDVKNLKLKLRPEEERKYNSPWNVAVDFPIDMSLSVDEICSMLQEYKEEKGISFETDVIAAEIYKYTSGYPFLVSLICLWMDERLSETDELPVCWSRDGVRIAVREILKGTNTLFDDVVKNIENNGRFRKFVEGILLEGSQIPYKLSNPEINLGVTFGIISEEKGICKISNIIFESYIYDHLIAGKLMEKQVLKIPRNQFIAEDGALDMNVVLKKFQDFMKAEYRLSDEPFIEKQGRLLFLSFLKPIINGTGHYVVEPETRSNTRMDIVIFYGKREYILELKIWHGEKRFEEGLAQLTDYMESRGQTEGWLLAFCFNEKREKKIEEYTREIKDLRGNTIYSVVV